MKKLFTVVLFLLGLTALYAQETKHDLIIKTDGTKLEVLVSEVDVDVVKYRMADNASGPLYTIRKSEIATILYSNGTTEVFKQQPQQQQGVVYQQTSDITKLFSQEDLRSYNGAKGLKGAGTALAIIGATCMVPGIVLGILVSEVFLYSMLPVGGAFLIAGCVMSGVGTVKMNSIENKYKTMSLYDIPLGKNSKNSVALSIHSNGLSLKF